MKSCCDGNEGVPVARVVGRPRGWDLMERISTDCCGGEKCGGEEAVGPSINRQRIAARR